VLEGERRGGCTDRRSKIPVYTHWLGTLHCVLINIIAKDFLSDT
jgi:hypothetical protein